MAQRTEALCDGKVIGIETIYTVINGSQIYNPERLAYVREKSHRKELFCPCGCGANLILVAGDKQLVEQHFRIDSDSADKECQAVIEGKTSIDSKIVLKCWLDDNLGAEDLESRKPISSISDSTRKYEFTFYSKSKGIALNYSHKRSNLSDEKMDILDDNSEGLAIIHVVDFSNSGLEIQYSADIMKVQKRQGYCLFLSIDGVDYDMAEMTATFYEQDADGLWEEIILAEGTLSEYRIDSTGSILFKGERLQDTLNREKTSFLETVKREKGEREKAKKEQQERIEKLREEREQKLKDLQRQKEEAIEKKRLAEEKAREEQRQRDETFKSSLSKRLDQQDNIVTDAYGNRWIKCESCGFVGTTSDFQSYGGVGHINLGTCKTCGATKHTEVVLKNPNREQIRPKSDPMACPIPNCGGRLVEKNGRFGKFYGCSNYPRCQYTKNY